MLTPFKIAQKQSCHDCNYVTILSKPQLFGNILLLFETTLSQFLLLIHITFILNIDSYIACSFRHDFQCETLVFLVTKLSDPTHRQLCQGSVEFLVANHSAISPNTSLHNFMWQFFRICKKNIWQCQHCGRLIQKKYFKMPELQEAQIH